MNKPYIICHMMTSVDGRIDCKMTEELSGVVEYYKTLDTFNAKSHISGRVTAELEMALPGKFVSKVNKPINKEMFHKAIASDSYEIILDTKGTLLWPRQEESNNPLLIITSKQVRVDYLEYLNCRNISFIVTGDKQIDLESACDILYNEFNVKRAALVGGGKINAGFLKLKLIDEISILIGAGIDGRSGMGAVFDGLSEDSNVTKLKLISVDSFDSGAVWIRYKL